MTDPDKVQINIMYAPHRGPAVKQYENDKGIIFMHNTYNKHRYNIGMSLYSLPAPRRKYDSIYIIEPKCVLAGDYNVARVDPFNNIFTWATKAFEGKIDSKKLIQTNHPSCYGMAGIEKIKEEWVPWKDRRDEIVFIANNKTSHHNSELYSARIRLADFLYNKSGLQVSWYGKIPLKNKKYYKGQLKNKKDVLRRVKFSVCTENSYDPVFSHNYFTEKMPEVWFAGAVPLYMGCFNIDDFGFASNSYIDLRKYVKRVAGKNKRDVNIDQAGLLSEIKNFNEQKYNEFKESVLDNMAKKNGLYHIISQQRCWDTMIDRIVLVREEERAERKNKDEEHAKKMAAQKKSDKS